MLPLPPEVVRAVTSYQGLRFDPQIRRGTFLCLVCMLSHVCVFSRRSDFLPQSKSMNVRFIESKLTGYLCHLARDREWIK